jgi:predicted ATPase
MIKRLHVKNFLSLRDVDLELTQRNVLVGPNMSGKSNLIECLLFLTQVAISGLNKALLDRNGFAEVVWKGSPSEQRIGISLCYEQHLPQEPPTNYEYEISILGSQAGFVSIEKESIVAEKEGHRFALAELADGRGVIVQELEAWLLADESAISKVISRPVRRQPDPIEDIASPKESLKRILSPELVYTREVARRIAAVADISRMADRCPVFKTF